MMLYAPMASTPVYDELVALDRAYKLADWLLMKEGVRVAGGNALYRQTKHVLSRLCGCVGLPAEGATRAVMIDALKRYEFTEAQLEEKRRFKAAEAERLRVARMSERIARLAEGPRPHTYATHAAIEVHRITMLSPSETQLAV